jgi:hypothetical protein
MRKVKHCKVALLSRKVEILPYFPSCVKLWEGSACESACLDANLDPLDPDPDLDFGINWKF